MQKNISAYPYVIWVQEQVHVWVQTLVAKSKKNNIGHI